MEGVRQEGCEQMLKRVGVGEEHVRREGSWRERWMDGKVMEAGPRSVVDNNDRHGCGPVWDGKRGDGAGG